MTPIWFLKNYDCQGYNYITLYTVKYGQNYHREKNIGIAFVIIISNQINIHNNVWKVDIKTDTCYSNYHFSYLVHHVRNEGSCGLVCLVYVHDSAGHEHVDVVMLHDGRAATPQRHDDSKGPHTLTLTLGQTSTHMIDATSMVTVQVTGKEIIEKGDTPYLFIFFYF